MREMSKESKPQRRIIILDSDECTPCEDIKKRNKEKIESGEIRVLDITSDEALELLKKAGAPDRLEYPKALVEDDKGIRVCDIYHDKEATLVACGDEIIAIREPSEEEPATP
ncbi:hypothetical protein ES707_03413 [subsurface metagenome]